MDMDLVEEFGRLNGRDRGRIRSSVENREFRDRTARTFERQNLLASGGRSFEDANAPFRDDIEALT